MADRYAYLPAIGLFLIASWGAHDLAGRLAGGAWLARVGAVAAASALALLTWRQVAYWSDDVTLFLRAAEVTARNGIAHLRVSQALAERGAYPEALAHGREAVRLEPENPRAHKNLGYVYYRVGLVDDAIAELRRAIQLSPGYAEAHGNLSIAYARKGLVQEAMEEMRTERQLGSGSR
jgi:tetratricopeptide (TPR) repeat protein